MVEEEEEKESEEIVKGADYVEPTKDDIQALQAKEKNIRTKKEE